MGNHFQKEFESIDQLLNNQIVKYEGKYYYKVHLVSDLNCYFRNIDNELTIPVNENVYIPFGSKIYKNDSEFTLYGDKSLNFSSSTSLNIVRTNRHILVPKHTKYSKRNSLQERTTCNMICNIDLVNNVNIILPRDCVLYLDNSKMNTITESPEIFKY